MSSPSALEQGLGGVHTDVLRGSSRLTAGLPQSTIAIETSHRPAQNEDDLAPQLNVETASAAPPLVRSPGSSLVLSESENVVAGAESEEPATFAAPSSSHCHHCGCSCNADDSSNEVVGVHADRYGGGKVEQMIFGPKPNIAWDCVRTRSAREFPGLERLVSKTDSYECKVASFVMGHTSHRVVRPTTSEWIGKENLQMKLPFMASFIAQWLGHTKPLYYWRPIRTSAKLPPPKGLYVVVGIFNDSGALLHEGIVYSRGHSLSSGLVLERRRLFILPILRDIKAFGLYKCDPVSRTHTKVDLRPEERDCLASLFQHVEKWSTTYPFHTLAISVYNMVVVGLLGGIFRGPKEAWLLAFLAFILTHQIVHIVDLTQSSRKVKKLEMQSFKEEIEWRDWIQDNLNESHDDPSKARYSLLCVIGWSKLNIILLVAVPFLLAALASIIFGVLWSIDIRSHKGDVQGAWGISSFIITLAATLAGLLGLVGGLFYR